MKYFYFIFSLLLIFSCTKREVNYKFNNEFEVRGTWLTNVDSDVFMSRENIAEAMSFLADHNFNLVCPVVWNKSLTLYKSAVMDSVFGNVIDSLYGERDPLKELIEEAHAKNIKVFAWFEYGFAASHKRKGGYIITNKPYWAAKDNEGKLLTKNGFEWMNAYHPEVQDFMLKLICEVVRNYNVDGVQGDDRLPAQPVEGGYSEYTVNLFKSEHNGAEPPKNFRDKNWMQWRASKLNAFAKRIYDSVKLIKKEVMVTWAPSILPFAYDEYLQDWKTWINDGYADHVYPQVYRYRLAEYISTLDGCIPEKIGLNSDSAHIFPGILINLGEYLINSNYLLSALERNRKKGFNGEVYFFYEGLRKDDDYLGKNLKNTFYNKSAQFPTKY